jgi:hypothetical protein
MDFAEIIEKGDRAREYDNMGEPLRTSVPQLPQQAFDPEVDPFG